MKERGWLQRIFDALDGITQRDYENCEKLKAVTGHDWEPRKVTVMAAGADLAYHYYVCLLPDHNTVNAMQTVMQKYMTDSEFGNFKDAEKSKFRAPNEQIGECSKRHLAISTEQYPRLVVMPHYDRDKFQSDLAQQIARNVEAEKIIENTVGSKIQNLKIA